MRDGKGGFVNAPKKEISPSTGQTIATLKPRIGKTVYMYGDGPSADARAIRAEIMVNLPANDSGLFPRTSSTPRERDMPRVFNPLLQWMRVPEGVRPGSDKPDREPVSTAWEVTPDNDNTPFEEGEQVYHTELSRETTPSVAEILRQDAINDTERNKAGQIVRIGKLLFSDGTQHECAAKDGNGTTHPRHQPALGRGMGNPFQSQFPRTVVKLTHVEPQVSCLFLAWERCQISLFLPSFADP